MSHSSAPMKMIWAIDPFDTETLPHANSLEDLKTWIRTSDIGLLPVFVAHSADALDHGDSEVMGVRATAQEYKKRIVRYMEQLGIPCVHEPKILFERSHSFQRMAGVLAHFAIRINADLILVSSHGRSGVGRWLMGSFAEKLLAQSPVPLFFLSHRGERLRGDSPQIALFATDFTEFSFAAYQVFLRQVEAFQSEIILYHDVTLPSFAMNGLAYSMIIPETYLEEQKSWALEESKRWVCLTQEKGVRVRELIEQGSLDTGGAILGAAAHEKADLIGMASQSRPMNAFFLGSVAREVFRKSLYPVWIFGPEAFERLNLKTSYGRNNKKMA